MGKKLREMVEEGFKTSPVERVGEAIGGKMGKPFDWGTAAAKRFPAGKLTASDTGAREYAQQRRNKRVTDAAGSMQSFEDVISGKSGAGTDKSTAKKNGHWWWETQ